MTAPTIYNATESWMKASVRPPVRFTRFCDKVIKLGSDGKPFTLVPHQRIIFDLADELYEQDVWNTFLFSTIKKSGKTELQAIAALKWALEHDDEELLLQGNDYDQSVGRVFKAVARLCKRNKIKCRILADRIIFPNGSEIRAIAADFAGEAGAQQGFHGVGAPRRGRGSALAFPHHFAKCLKNYAPNIGARQKPNGGCSRKPESPSLPPRCAMLSTMPSRMPRSRIFGLRTFATAPALVGLRRACRSKSGKSASAISCAAWLVATPT